MTTIFRCILINIRFDNNIKIIIMYTVPTRSVIHTIIYKELHDGNSKDHSQQELLFFINFIRGPRQYI